MVAFAWLPPAVISEALRAAIEGKKVELETVWGTLELRPSKRRSRPSIALLRNLRDAALGSRLRAGGRSW